MYSHCSSRVACFILYVAIMDSLVERCGISRFSTNMTSSDITLMFEQVPLDNLKCLRSELFSVGVRMGLIDSRDILVNRKNSVTSPLRKKLIEDIFLLDRCAKCKEGILRILVSGGKKSHEELEHSHNLRSETCILNPPSNASSAGASQPVQQPISTTQQLIPMDNTPAPSHIPVTSSSIRSSANTTSLRLITSDLNLLRNEVESIKSTLHTLKTATTALLFHRSAPKWLSLRGLSGTRLSKSPLPSSQSSTPPPEYPSQLSASALAAHPSSHGHQSISIAAGVWTLPHLTLNICHALMM